MKFSRRIFIWFCRSADRLLVSPLQSNICGNGFESLLWIDSVSYLSVLYNNIPLPLLEDDKMSCGSPNDGRVHRENHSLCCATWSCIHLARAEVSRNPGQVRKVGQALLVEVIKHTKDRHVSWTQLTFPTTKDVCALMYFFLVKNSSSRAERPRPDKVVPHNIAATKTCFVWSVFTWEGGDRWLRRDYILYSPHP